MYQGHRAKVTFVNLIILTIRPRLFCFIKVKVILRSRSFKGQGHFKVLIDINRFQNV